MNHERKAVAELTPAERIAAAEAKREALRSAEARAHEAQKAIDTDALVELEIEHGYERILRVDLTGWTPNAGAATMVIARVPLRRDAFFRRFEETVAKPKADTLKAMHTLAEACIVYPDRKTAPDLYEATLDLAAGALSMVAQQIVQRIQGKADEEKKD